MSHAIKTNKNVLPSHQLRAVQLEKTRPPMMAELRRRAVGQLRKLKKKSVAEKAIQQTQTDVLHTLHELQVHQIELEMQNMELQEARDRMEGQLEKYTDLYDFAPVGYFSLDEQGVVLEANLTGAALLSVERSRLINQCLTHFVSPASHADFLAFLNQVFAGSEKQSRDLPLVTAEGATLWARFRGVLPFASRDPRKWCRVSVADITAFKQAEEAVARLAAIVRSSEDAIISKSLDGRISTWNRGAERLFGYLAAEAVGQPLAMLFDRHHLVAGISKRIHRGESIGSFETVCRHKEGRLVDVSLTISPITDEQGRIVGMSKIMRDITEHKRLEATQHRLDVLAASHKKMTAEIARRAVVEKALKKSESHQRRLLDESRRMHEQLRLLARQILSVQEEERKQISRELHDVIAQTLTGINIRLAALKKNAAISKRGLDQSIDRTQKLVSKSVELVHDFARELRPAVLDDLGLIPALHSFMKSFTARTGIRTYLQAFAGTDPLDIARRTVFYRVGQEALTNVARHAHASSVKVSILKEPGCIVMKVTDDGTAFVVDAALKSRDRKHLGLLGMRERLEMVGGCFHVESVPGQGTTVQARIPLGKPNRLGNAPACASCILMLRYLAKNRADGKTARRKPVAIKP